LDALCARTRCIISAVGPYRFFGEEVVVAAVKAGIIYLDVTGEPQFMESMLLKYNTEAIKTGALIVHACGFDSIPGIQLQPQPGPVLLMIMLYMAV
jgi:short subunit dehydrogenase-like uncharacterized protein